MDLNIKCLTANHKMDNIFSFAWFVFQSFSQAIAFKELQYISPINQKMNTQK